MTGDGFRALKRLEHNALALRAAMDQIANAALCLSSERTEHHDAIMSLDEADRRAFARAVLNVGIEMHEALKAVPAAHSLLHDTWQLICPEMAAEYEDHAAAERPAQH